MKLRAVAEAEAMYQTFAIARLYGSMSHYWHKPRLL